MGIVILPRMVPDLVAPVGGTPIGSLSVGSVVKMNVGGKPYEWIIVNQGRPSTMYDVSCDGTWLLLKDIYENRQWHSSNVNDYENSTIDDYLNGAWFNLLDVNIRNAVKQVRIPYRPGSQSNDTHVNSGVNGLLTRVFLLSSYEVGYGHGDASNYSPKDGSRLAYFNDGSGSDPKRVAYMNGNPTDWWLRSPYCDPNPSSFAIFSFIVGTTGRWSYTTCSRSYGVRPTLILNDDTLVDSSGNVIGG